MIIFLSTNLADCSACFAIAGIRYEYFFRERSTLDRIEACARWSSNRALHLAKRNATKVTMEKPDV